MRKREKVTITGFYSDGVSVNGNAKWYKDSNGNFVWSGAAKEIATEPKVAVAPSSRAASTSNSLSAAVGPNCPNKKSDVELVQQLLKAKGLSLTVDGLFGKGTTTAIKNFQKGALGFGSGDGRVDVGGKTWQGLNDALVTYTAPKASSGKYDGKYKDVTIQGSVFPDAKIYTTLKISLSTEMRNEYLPAMEKALAGSSDRLKLMCTIMAHKEGFYKGTRSYRTNNPGNIGNTDSGANNQIASLEDGIKRQKQYIDDVIAGKHSAYPMNKKKIIKPYYSPEIAKNPQYGLDPYLPGYEFVFTGQLDQFVKIYSTGARGGNSYLSTIISYFKSNGIVIDNTTTLSEIVGG